MLQELFVQRRKREIPKTERKSTRPTIDSLKFFFSKISKNGIILFDDYGFNEHLETKIAVDKYLINKKGSLFHLPTGQSIFFKK